MKTVAPVALYLRKRIQHGMTLLELMVVIAIVAILATIAVPSFIETVRSTRVSSMFQLVYTSINLARSESLKRGVRVSMAVKLPTSLDMTNSGGITWRHGWDVFVDTNNNGYLDAGEQVLLSQEATDAGIYLASNALPASPSIGAPLVGPPSFVNGRPTTVAGAIGAFRFTVGLTLKDTGVNGNSTSLDTRYWKMLCVNSMGRTRTITPGSPGSLGPTGSPICPLE